MSRISIGYKCGLMHCHKYPEILTKKYKDHTLAKVKDKEKSVTCLHVFNI